MPVTMTTYQSFFLFFKLITNQSVCENLSDSHAYLQSSHGRKLNIVARVVKFLTYVQVVAKCESLLCGYGTSCTVKEHTFNLTVSGEVKVATSVKNLSRLCFDFGF